MASRCSLRSFVIQARSTLRKTLAEGKGRLDFVVGNESADLDSLTSSLLYAYVCSSNLKSYFPLVNIPEADVRLRPEFSRLLGHADMGSDLLITLDDLPQGEGAWRKLLDGAGLETSWTLVDHNRLQGVLGSLFAHQVVGIIDHHAVESQSDEPSDTRITRKEPYVITTSGSCTSLVTEYVRDRWPNPEASQTTHPGQALWNAEIAKLALASILIDTTNLTDKDKVTAHDTTAVAYLEQLIQASPDAASTYDRSAFFEDIRAAKEDLGPLSVAEVLRKDYKQWDEGGLTLGISSAVKPIEWLVQHGELKDSGSTHLLDTINRFAGERQLDIFALMTAFRQEDEFRRELLVLGLSEKGSKVAQRFQNKEGQELGLEQMEVESVKSESEGHAETFLNIWRQKNVQHSRKRVAPLIREAMREI